MVTATTKFTAATGNTFDTEYDAWKDELRAWLVAHGADNDAIARKIVGAIDDGQPDTLDALAAIVTGMKDAAPLTAMKPPGWDSVPIVDYYPPTAARPTCDDIPF